MFRSALVASVRSGLLSALVLLFAQPIVAADGAFQESSIRGYDYTGFTAQFGVSVGEINFDDSDSDTSGGFTFGGNYRFLPWLAGDANFSYLGGGDVEVGNVNVGEGSFFAFTFGPKFYPLGLFKTEVIPHFIQPYGTIGIGGGEFDIDGRSGFHDRSSFIARFILGFDVWATDHLGFFVEGGGHAASEDDVEGVGLFTVGGQYRF